MNFLVFAVASVALYVAADRILKTAERVRGRPFADRSVAFFLILLGLAVVVLPLIGALMAN